MTRKDLADTKVFNRVDKYIKEHNLNYELLFVIHSTNLEADDYLYMVAAKRKEMNDYVCWTCWNDITQSLNWGHYNLESEEECMEIMNRFREVMKGA